MTAYLLFGAHVAVGEGVATLVDAAHFSALPMRGKVSVSSRSSSGLRRASTSTATATRARNARAARATATGPVIAPPPVVP
jgi:hypothetical protein